MTSHDYELPPDLLPLAEAAKLLPSRKPCRTVHAVTVYRWVERGRLQGYKVGGVWHVSRRDVLALVVRSEVRPEVASRAERMRQIERAEAEVRGG